MDSTYPFWRLKVCHCDRAWRGGGLPSSYVKKVIRASQLCHSWLSLHFVACVSLKKCLEINLLITH
jgi:hypothetical protein